MTRSARLAAAVLAASCALTPAAAAGQDQGGSFVQPGADRVAVAEAEPAVFAPNLGKGPRALEWTAGLRGGSYRGPQPKGDAGALELGLGVGWTSFALGLRLSLVTMGREFGYGVAGQLGPRLRVSDQVRLELLADVGIESYSSDSEVDLVLVSKKTEGSSKTLPAVGLRAGVMLLSQAGGAAVTLGMTARWTQSATVDYQSGACVALVFCATGTEKAIYGGRMFGAYLTVTRLSLLGT